MSVKQHEAFCFDSFQDMLLFFDDFHGDQIQDEWNSTFIGAGTNAVTDQQTGGIVRLTTGAILNDGNQLDWNDIRSLLVSKRVSMEFRVKIENTLNQNVIFGFQFDATHRFQFRQIATATWYIYSQDAGGNVNQDSGVAIDTSFHIFRIEAHTHGANHLHFYIDGTETGNSPITTNVTTNYGQPYIFLRTKEANDKVMDVDYCYVRQER